ncbi:hypothetical protein BDD43_3502 [Mucilaginibacter gracilis]|uniref:Uncharacterized protein n=1 Tax=Mucilaginibacter gracilis TaxID=423350 RepID=A0A495J2Z1_9SPHI|nr:hypothetical protein [Mucilaginibacter gracilis]RKR83297.1 hypothetical protein BDD43_3502 [Mucilaginibacter gracilis]
METKNIKITEKQHKNLEVLKTVIKDYFYESSLSEHLDDLFSTLNNACETTLHPESMYVPSYVRNLIYSTTRTALLLVRLNEVNTRLDDPEN